jgi:hypothetical protein
MVLRFTHELIVLNLFAVLIEFIEYSKDYYSSELKLGRISVIHLTLIQDGI